MNLEQQIKDKGLKKSWIASKIGVSNPMFSMFLSGERNLPEEKIRQIKDLVR
jgi:predicted transcriptional regulator